MISVDFYKVTRADLPKALGSAENRRPSSYQPTLNGGALERNEVGIGFWQEGRHTAPDFIVINDHQSREFFAWVRSYVQAATPVSQWCRVLSWSEFEDFTRRIPPNVGLGRFATAWAGAIIGECIAQTGNEDARNALNFVSCQATYSYAAARSLAVWGPRYSWAAISERIDRCLTVFGASERRLESRSLAAIWDVLSNLDQREAGLFPRRDLTQVFSRCCREVMETGAISNSVNALREYYQETLALQALDQLSAEQRLLLLRSVGVEASQSKGLGDEKRQAIEFVMAYIASKIGGGWRNIDSLAEWTSVAPLAPVWFGILFALMEPTIYGSTFDGLSRLVLRELEAVFHQVERPKCDISIDELEATILPNLDSRNALRTAHSRIAQVELFPGVITYVALEPRREQPRARRPEQALGNVQPKEPTSQLEHLASEINRIFAVLRRNGMIDEEEDRREMARSQPKSKRQSKTTKRLF